jgi:hypothetical protein
VGADPQERRLTAGQPDVDETGPRDNLVAGAIFLAFGAAFAYTSSTYDVGTLLSMGPGYFPLVLGLVLAGLGLVIMATGLLLRRREVVSGPSRDGTQSPGRAAEPGTAEPRVGEPSGAEPSTDSEERGSIPWARGALLMLAIVFFGATVDGLGLAPALLVTVFLAALAGPGTSWRAAALISVGLTVLSVLVFVTLLQLRIPLVGAWLGG